ncbi:MAG TPA: flagellin FliC, partial [Halomonas sp.]|nr:flagellin FliC [Halomonas sp.]
MISLATNIMSLLVMNNLRSSQQAMQTSMERLSSG